MFPISHSKRLQLGVAQCEIVPGSLCEQFPDTSSGPLAVLIGCVLATVQKAGGNRNLCHLAIFLRVGRRTPQDHACLRPLKCCT
jgi:hypothetical protein